MHTFALLSSVITLAALFGFVSYRFLRLPTTVGTMMLALLLAGVLLVAGAAGTGIGTVIRNAAGSAIGQLDFGTLVLHGMLAFLLFAAALSLNLEQLRQERLPVLALAVAGTVLSTALVATLLYVALPLIGLRPDARFCMLFGALIAPTDPIAVIGMLRRVGAPAALETQLAGESLFNDGVGAVIFLALLESGEGTALSASHLLRLLAEEAGGGIMLGIALGYAAYRLLRLVDNYLVEVTLTLALAMGTYSLADQMHLSAPLAVIAAGLLVNGHRRFFREGHLAMSHTTRESLATFWELVEEIMNVVLFLLLGLELLAVPLQKIALLAGLLAIPIVLLSRYCSVGTVFLGMRPVRPHTSGSVRALTWAGLRGGLSVALALGMPAGPQRSLALTMTYVVVVFSVLVQGLTVGGLLKRLGLQAAA